MLGSVIMKEIIYKGYHVARKKHLATWYEAKEWCIGLGNGWRIPSIIELAAITKDDYFVIAAKENLFLNKNFGIWSEEKDEKFAYKLELGESDLYFCDKKLKQFSIAIKDKKSYSPGEMVVV